MNIDIFEFIICKKKSYILYIYLINNSLNRERNACAITTVQTKEIINMTRNIDLTNYSGLIREGRARAAIYSSVGFSTIVYIMELRKNERKLSPDDWFSLRWIQLLGTETTNLQITLLFSDPMNKIDSWFHDLQLHIYTDIRAPDTDLMHLKQT